MKSQREEKRMKLEQELSWSDLQMLNLTPEVSKPET